MSDTDNKTEEISPKSRLTATLLAVFLGVFGIHRLYLGKTASAYGMMALGIAGFSILGTIFSVGNYYRWPGMPQIGVITFFIAVGIWSLVDFIVIVSGRMRDSEGRLIKKW